MLEFSRREKWFIGLIYAIPILVLFAALIMAFTHAMEWAARHDSGAWWEHLAFALMIEFPALLGLLLMTLWPKIGGGRKPVIPRVLFLVAAGFSQFVQQAYAGSDASASTRFVAGVPSVVAMVFIEIVFWVMGLIDEAKTAASQAAAGPAPVVVPPPPMVIPVSPLANVPLPQAPVPPDSLPLSAGVSPWTTPPGTPLPADSVPPDTQPDVQVTGGMDRGDKVQATATVPPSVSPSAGGEDTAGQDLPDQVDNDALSPALSPTVSGGHDPQDSPEEDTAPEGDSGDRDGGTAGLDAVDLDTWTDHKAGLSKKELATKHGVSEKTIQRRLAKVRLVIDTTTTEEEHANA